MRGPLLMALNFLILWDDDERGVKSKINFAIGL